MRRHGGILSIAPNFRQSHSGSVSPIDTRLVRGLSIRMLKRCPTSIASSGRSSRLAHKATLHGHRSKRTQACVAWTVLTCALGPAFAVEGKPESSDTSATDASPKEIVVTPTKRLFYCRLYQSTQTGNRPNGNYYTQLVNLLAPCL
jgi:hypothetical protein